MFCFSHKLVAISKRNYLKLEKDEHLVRLHIGLEDPKDLINDLKNRENVSTNLCDHFFK